MRGVLGELEDEVCDLKCDSGACEWACTEEFWKEALGTASLLVFKKCRVDAPWEVGTEYGPRHCHAVSPLWSPLWLCPVRLLGDSW